MKAGAASRVINNELGAWVQGASVDKRAERVRDDLEANVLFLSNDDETVLLISCDVAALEREFVEPAREATAEAAGCDPRAVVITATHTHTGPVVLHSNRLKPVDTAYLERLRGLLTEAAQEAAETARPVRVGWGTGVAQVGYNRRCCWADGTHTMHGDTHRPDFVGLEGPEDPQHLALFFRDASGKPVAVLHHNTSHPTCFYGKNFYSADFPGAARKYLREALGPVPVLFFNGAFGDQSIEKQTAPERAGETPEQKMLRAAHLIAGETLRLLHEEVSFRDEVALAHVYEDLRVGVRLPASDKLEEARKVLEKVDAGEEVDGWSRMWAHGIDLLQRRFGYNPVDTLPLHALRIGEVAFLTQPCELYCQFGLDLKRRGPVPRTAVVGLADGCAGYCPTPAALLGGGYSADPLYWCRLSFEAGPRLVDAGARLLHKLWKHAAG